MNPNKIYTTTDYGQFVFRSANRTVDEKHVKRLEKLMQENGWKGKPIEVSEDKKGKLVIEDGQHRYTAAKNTKTPIKYMVVPAKTIYEISIENNANKGWKMNDYIDAYSDGGMMSYKRLKQLKTEFPNLPIDTILRTINENAVRKEILAKGQIRFSDEQFYLARENLKTIEMFYESMVKFKIKTKAVYTRNLVRIMKAGLIDGDRLMDKMDKYGNMLLPKAVTDKQAAEELEKLYNYHQQRGIVSFHFVRGK